MKKIAFLAAFALTASSALASFNANLTQLGSFGSGGAFKVVLSGSPPSYLEFGNIGGNKTTFCVEHITFSPGTTYIATVDPGILYGGPGATLALTAITKNLFAEYVKGDTKVGGMTLAEYVGTDVDRNEGLQNLFWSQQTAGISNGGAGPAAAAAYILANWGTTGNAAAAYVQVLNLWEGAAYLSDKQSHLVMVPAPGAALLGLIGLAGVRWVRRKIA